MKLVISGVVGYAVGWFIRDIDVIRHEKFTDQCEICSEHIGWFPRSSVHKICAFRAHLDQVTLPKNWIKG